MVFLKISEEELNAAWDRIEAKHPWGPLTVEGSRRVSDYLMRAMEVGLVTRDVAEELCWAAMGVGTTNP